MPLISNPPPENRWYITPQGDMIQSTPVLIYQDKKKSIQFLLIATVFVIISCWMLLTPAKNNGRLLEIPVVHVAVAIAGIVFFGLGMVIFFKRIVARKPAVIIDQNGIVDNASATGAGSIPWCNVSGFNTIHVSGQKMIVVFVTTPDAYVHQHRSIFLRRAAGWNWKRYGSPVIIPVSTLKTDHQVLLQQLREYRYRALTSEL